MRRLISNLTVTAMIFGAASTATAKNMGGIEMSVLTGTCDKLVFGEANHTKHCIGKLLSTAYPDRRVGFYFTLDNDVVFTFSGIDGENPSEDADVVNIDKVIMGGGADKQQPKQVSAKGKCQFSNPMTGDPMTTTCSGRLEDGTVFSAIFTTDGQPPQ